MLGFGTANVLSEGFDLAAATQVDRGLSAAITGYRWVQLFAQIGQQWLDDPIVVPVSAIPAYAAPTILNLYALASNNNSLYTINRNTGSAMEVGPTGISGTWNSLAWDGMNLYAVRHDNRSLYVIDRARGVATPVAQITGDFPSFLSNLAWADTDLYLSLIHISEPTDS